MTRELLANGGISGSNFLEIPMISSAYWRYDLVFSDVSYTASPPSAAGSASSAILELDVSTDHGVSYDHDNCHLGRYYYVWAAALSSGTVLSRANTNDAEIETSDNLSVGGMIDGVVTFWHPLASGTPKKFMFDCVMRNNFSSFQRIIGAGLYRGSNGAPDPVNAIRLSWSAYWDKNWPLDCVTRDSSVQFATGNYSFYGNA